MQTPGDGEGQGSLECCSPWGCKESDMTERLNNSSIRERTKQISYQTRPQLLNGWPGTGAALGSGTLCPLGPTSRSDAECGLSAPAILLSSLCLRCWCSPPGPAESLLLLQGPARMSLSLGSLPGSPPGITASLSLDSPGRQS